MSDFEKGHKVVTRGGQRYYASGPNAGKKVGTVRGQGGSKQSSELKTMMDEVNKPPATDKQRAEAKAKDKKAENRFMASYLKHYQNTSHSNAVEAAQKETGLKMSPGNLQEWKKQNPGALETAKKEAAKMRESVKKPGGVSKMTPEAQAILNDESTQYQIKKITESDGIKGGMSYVKDVLINEGMGFHQATTNSIAWMNEQKEKAKNKESEKNMSKSIDEELEQIAENMEKSTSDAVDLLKSTIAELGPEAIRARLNDLDDEQKMLMASVLDEMNVEKAAEFDAEASGASYFPGKVYKDSVIQEDQVSDDADEKLVKPEGAIQNHQGTPTDGWSGKAIADPTDGDETGQEVDTGKNMIKSMKLEFTNIDEYYDDEDILTLAKCFGDDYDVIEDFVNSDDDEFLDDLIEKGAKTVTRNGIRYYSEGKNAGKPVGAVRGDKASAKAIARARQKGKISAQAANRGIKDAGSKAQYERQRAKVGMGAASGKDDKTIQADARKKLAEKKHRYDSGSESKGKYKELTNELKDKTKNLKEARDKASKDPSKKNRAAVSKERERVKEDINENRRKMGEHIKDSNQRSKKMQARLKAKRDKMKKSEENMNDLYKAMASDETMTKMMYKMMHERGMSKADCMSKMMEKGMDEARAKRLIDSAMKEHQDKMHKGEPMMKKMSVQEAVKAIMGEETVSDIMKKVAPADRDNVLKQLREKKQMDKAMECEKCMKGMQKSEAEEADLAKGKMKKALWAEANELLKSRRGGRNHSFSVNEYYDAMLTIADYAENPDKYVEAAEDMMKAHAERQEAENLEKAKKMDKAKVEIEVEDDEDEKEDKMDLHKKKMKKSEDINDLIERGETKTWGDLDNEAGLKKSHDAVNGRYYSTFSDKELAEALGLDEEEAKKILG